MRPGWYGGYHTPRAPFVYGARFGLFPRLFWFALGAGAYSFWSKCGERHRSIAAGAGHNGEWRHWSNNHWGCHRRREQLEQQQRQDQHRGSNEPNDPPQPTQYPAGPTSAPTPPQMTAVMAPAQSPGPANTPAPPPPPPTSPAPNSTEWQAERFREATKQASETVSEMSEKAIDALMTNLQTVKAKIVEAREARERERDRPHLEQREDKQNPREGSPPERAV